MTIEQIMEYLKALPILMQFILLFLSVAGTSGLIAGVFAVWKLYASADAAKQAAADARAMADSQARIEKELAEQKLRHEKELAEQKSQHEKELAEQTARIDELELRRIQAQSEARQVQAAAENMDKLIDALSTGNDRWQHVVDVKSERQLEADKLQHETNKMFIAAVKQQTETVANISEMLEIQSEHLGGFGRVMQHFENKLDDTVKTIETSTRDNRSDLTTALGMNVSHRTENESNLRSILQAIDSLRTDVKHILTQSETQRNQTLSSVDAKFKLIEERLTEFINPRPALLGMPETTDTRDDEEDNRPDEVA